MGCAGLLLRRRPPGYDACCQRVAAPRRKSNLVVVLVEKQTWHSKCRSSYSSPRNSRYLCLPTSAPLKPKRHQSSESSRSHNSTKFKVLDNVVRPLSRMHLAPLNQSPTIPAAAARWHNQRQREARPPPCPNQWYTSPPRCQLDGFAEML